MVAEPVFREIFHLSCKYEDYGLEHTPTQETLRIE